MSDLTDLAAAVRDALDVPYAADGSGPDELRLLSLRAAFLVGALGRLADGDDSTASATVAAVRQVSEKYPIDYPVRDEQPGSGVVIGEAPWWARLMHDLDQLQAREAELTAQIRALEEGR